MGPCLSGPQRLQFINCTCSYIIFNSKIHKIRNCEHIQVPGGSNKWGPTVCIFIRVVECQSAIFAKCHFIVMTLAGIQNCKCCTWQIIIEYHNYAHHDNFHGSYIYSTIVLRSQSEMETAQKGSHSIQTQESDVRQVNQVLGMNVYV